MVPQFRRECVHCGSLANSPHVFCDSACVAAHLRDNPRNNPILLWLSEAANFLQADLAAKHQPSEPRGKATYASDMERARRLKDAREIRQAMRCIWCGTLQDEEHDRACPERGDLPYR